MTAPFRRGENVATQPRPIPPRQIRDPSGYIPPVWEDGPPTVIALVALIGAGIAVAILGFLAMGLR